MFLQQLMRHKEQMIHEGYPNICVSSLIFFALSANQKLWKQLTCLLALHYLTTSQIVYRDDTAQNYGILHAVVQHLANTTSKFHTMVILKSFIKQNNN
jgi:hypothetical protein